MKHSRMVAFFIAFNLAALVVIASVTAPGPTNFDMTYAGTDYIHFTFTNNAVGTEDSITYWSVSADLADTTWVMSITTTAGTTSGNITGLSANTLYRGVLAVVRNDSTRYSAMDSLTTAAADTLIAPSALTLISKTQTSITVEVVNNYSGADSVALYLAADSTLVSGSVSSQTNVGTHRITVTGLTMGTTYTWVAGVDSSGTFKYSSSLSTTTLFPWLETTWPFDSIIPELTKLQWAASPYTAPIDSLILTGESDTDSTAVYKLPPGSAVTFEAVGDSSVFKAKVYAGWYDTATGEFNGTYVDSLEVAAAGKYKIDIGAVGRDFFLKFEADTDNGGVDNPTTVKNIYAIRPKSTN